MSGRLAADTRDVTLIQRRTDNRIRTCTDPVLASIRLRAGIAIAAGGAITGAWIGALPSYLVTRARDVTLILCQTYDRVRPSAGSGLACIQLRAGIAIGASGAVPHGRIRALPGNRVARAYCVTLVLRGTRNRISPSASPILARVCLRAGVAIVAGGSVAGVWTGALAGDRVAYTRYVARVLGEANDQIRSGACPVLASIGLCATVPVAAGGTIRCVRVRALTGCRVA